ncbi:hypothetical protein PHYBOEH_009090 [Phytophthora boehmeriae]|uniref:Sugar transporter SWEET1 n=1 Tax=Phytophthora boehmeriae TaxID=109152 RepID=A0A8T1W034_9STRA|nr:hypothetical protein PHYBOEH_009090 [Phytophthora boehmeriae]
MSGWETVLGVATAVGQVVLNLSPVPDIVTVYRRREIGELAALPLVAMAVNCHFWLVYAYVVDSMFPLFATQVFGQAAAIVYNVVYYHWSTPDKRKGLRKLYAWAFAIHCALSVYTVVGVLGLTNQSESQVATYLGYAGVVIDVWLFGSPLATLKHVIKTKYAASIPINLSMMMFVSTTLWTVSGALDSDIFLGGLNAIGSVLSFAQIVFWMIYRPKRNDQDTVMLNLSLTPDMYNIYRRRNTGDMAVLPLVSMFVNTHLWMFYGYLTGSTFPVGITQGLGELAAFTYNVVYFRFSSTSQRKELRKVYAGAFALYCAITLYFVLGVAGATHQSHNEVGTWLGYVGTAISVVVFASPFATLKRVVETKSAASIPINLSLMILVSSVLWVATGLLDSDYFITGLNAAGVVLGSIQIVLYCMYRPSREKHREQTQEHEVLPTALSPQAKPSGTKCVENPTYTSMHSPLVITPA